MSRWNVALLSLGLTLAAAVLAAGPARALSHAEARHLLARTGFGATLAEIRDFEPLSRDQAIERVLSQRSDSAATPAPDWVGDPVMPPRRLRAMSDEERQRFRRARIEEAIELQAWWYREMVASPSPLTERMTLFWHNHFTSSIRKVKSPHLMYRQNVLLRRHALGNFRDLLHAIARDPAMIIYLDNVTNRRGRPNENFARELLELFTLGEGHYSERDIKEAARAFTGWSLNRRSGEYRFVARWHDHGEKVFMGRRGNLNGSDIVEIVLQHPQVSVHVARKLWREFVSDTPDPAEIGRIAEAFRASDYDISVALAETLSVPQFWDPGARGALVKSPVELLVGTIRQFELRPQNVRRLPRIGRHLGQAVLDPPNVKGWPGGTAWITADSLLARQQVLEMFTRRAGLSVGTNGRAAGGRNGMGWLSGWMNDLDPDQRRPDALIAFLLPVPPVHPPAPGQDPARLMRHLLLDPAYQLK